MPPVFGPVSPSPTRLKSCAGASGTARVAVADREHRQLGAGHALLDDDRATRVAERLARQLGPHVGLGLGEVDSVTRTPLPGGQAVGLDDVRRRPASRGRRRAGSTSVEGAVPRGGHAGRGEQLLHLRLRALRAGRRRRPGRRRACPAARRRSARPSTSGCLRPDDEEVGLELLRRRGHRAGDAGVARA